MLPAWHLSKPRFKLIRVEPPGGIENIGVDSERAFSFSTRESSTTLAGVMSRPFARILVSWTQPVLKPAQLPSVFIVQLP